MLTLLLMLAAQAEPWVPPGTFERIEVAKLIQPQDCTATRCDWSPALERAQAMMDDVPSPQFAFRLPGGHFMLPCGAGNLSQPLVLRRPHTLEGCGGTFPGATTLLNALHTEAPAITISESAHGFALRHFYLTTLVGATSNERHGVLIRARGDIEEVSIRGAFVDGFHIFGDHSAPGNPNVNGAKIRGGRVDLVERYALFQKGQDANANTIESLDVGANCKKGTSRAEILATTTGWSRSNGIITVFLDPPANLKAGRFVQFRTASGQFPSGPVLAVAPAAPALTTSLTIAVPGPNSALSVETGDLHRPCANIFDESFLGNNYFAIQTATAKDTTTGEVFRSYVLAGVAARSVCMGCYAEDDQLKGYLSPLASVIGAVSGWEGPGFRMEGRRVNGIKAVGMPATGDTIAPELWIGGNDWGPPGTVLTMMPPQSGSSAPTYTALRWRMNNKSWYSDIASSGTAVSQRISTEAAKLAVTITRSSTVVKP